MPRPDFIVIGAMKCGTTTLQMQLAAQPGVFMTTPKEPNFFSDDAVFALGMAWYEALFAGAGPGDLKGEASTHYTKLPTHPHSAERIYASLPDLRLIYMVRDPFERLVSHYIHEWSMGVMDGDLDRSVAEHPELVDYGRYAMQIAPYLERYGRERILVTSLERFKSSPQAELARVGRFLGASRPFLWQPDLREANVSAERIRRFPLYDLVVDHPFAEALRRALVPRALRDAVKARLRMRSRPELSPALRERLAPVFAEDRAALERLFPELTEPVPA